MKLTKKMGSIALAMDMSEQGTETDRALECNALHGLLHGLLHMGTHMDSSTQAAS